MVWRPRRPSGSVAAAATNRTRRSRKQQHWRCTGQPGTDDGFFWQQRGKTLAEASLSLKTCRQQFIGKTFKNVRSLGAHIKFYLQTIHPNPGPRDKTEEGKARRRERRKLRREEKRKNKNKNNQSGEVFDIITWNVQRMSLGTFNKRKVKAVAEIARKNNWDAVLLSEISAKNDGTIWLGQDENLIAITFSRKAAILIRGQLLKLWCEGGQRTIRKERSITIKARDLSLTSVYMPVWKGNNEEEIEAAKEDLKSHIDGTKADEIVLVGGDFNAHIGQNEHRPGICGKFGLRSSNRQGEELIDFCVENNLAYCNSFYQHKRRGTWYNLALRKWYELDGFLMKSNQRHKFVKKINVINEIALSDHKPVRIRLVTNKPKKHFRPRQYTPKIKWEKLRETEVANNYRDKIREIVEEAAEANNNVNDRWKQITDITIKAATEVCGVEEKKIENPWMVGKEEQINRMRNRITECVNSRNELMDRSRMTNDREEKTRIEAELNNTTEELKIARRTLQRETREWEKTWWENLIQECQTAGERGDAGTLYKTLKKLGTRGIKTAPETTTLTKDNFKEHFQSISKDRFENDPEILEEAVEAMEDLRENEEAKRLAEMLEETPSREEIITQMKKMKNSAPGKDGVRLIYILQGGQIIIDKVVELIQFMFEHDADEWEEVLKLGLVIPLFKKGDRNNANNFRGVVLLAMGSRVLGRIAADRLRIWSENLHLLDDDQSGFRKDRSTADVTQIMYRILEDTEDLVRRLEAKGEPLTDDDRPAARLLDLRKAYPRVNKPALWRILEKYGMGPKFLRVIRDLHETTFYRIKSREGESDEWITERGLREGGPSSPPLFNIFHQVVMRQANLARKRKAEETGLEYGIHYNWVPGSCFPNKARWEKGNSEAKRIKISQGLFADDTTVIGKKRELEQGVREVKNVMNKFEERNNEDKEEFLDFGKEESRKIRVLGCLMGWKEDTNNRIKKAGNAWMKVKNRLKGTRISKSLQARIIEACIESTMLFDCQTRTWQVGEIQKMQRCMDKKYRHIWSKKTKPPLFQMQEEEKNMQDIRNELKVKTLRYKIEKRVLQRIGHVMRMDDSRMTKAVTLGWMEDLERTDKVPGKKRKTVLYWQRIIQEAGMDWTKIGQLTKDRKIWRTAVKKRMKYLEKWERRKGKKIPETSGNRHQAAGTVNSLRCSYEGCGIICFNKSGLINHERRKHEQSSQKNKFKCISCDSEFPYKSNLTVHRKCCTGLVARDSNKIKCNYCDKEISKSNFARHRKKCAPEQANQQNNIVARTRSACDICGKNISSSNLARHKRTFHQ